MHKNARRRLFRVGLHAAMDLQGCHVPNAFWGNCSFELQFAGIELARLVTMAWHSRLLICSGPLPLWNPLGQVSRTFSLLSRMDIGNVTLIAGSPLQPDQQQHVSLPAESGKGAYYLGSGCAIPLIRPDKFAQIATQCCNCIDSHLTHDICHMQKVREDQDA